MRDKVICSYCRDVIGVYEPVVVIGPDGRPLETSELRDHELLAANGSRYHRACWATVRPGHEDPVAPGS